MRLRWPDSAHAWLPAVGLVGLVCCLGLLVWIVVEPFADALAWLVEK